MEIKQKTKMKFDVTDYLIKIINGPLSFRLKVSIHLIEHAVFRIEILRGSSSL